MSASTQLGLGKVRLYLRIRLYIYLVYALKLLIIFRQNSKYKLYILAANIGYSNYYEVSGEQATFRFNKLPEIIGTGKTDYLLYIFSIK